MVLFAILTLSSARASDATHIHEGWLPVELSPAGEVSVFVFGSPCINDFNVVTDFGCHPALGVLVAIYADGPLPFTPLGKAPLVSAVTPSDGWVTFDGLPPGTYRWRAEMTGRPTEEGRVEFVDRAHSGCKTLEPMVRWGRSVPRIECPIGFGGAANRLILRGAMFTVELDEPAPVYDGRAAAGTWFSADDLQRLPMR